MTYIQGFVQAVPTANKSAYTDMARKAWVLFKEYGAISACETWGDDVPDGKLTSFPMAVKKEETETVVFSWIVWPDKETCTRCFMGMEQDDRWKDMMPEVAPFDMKRMIYGGFEPIFEGT